MSERSGRHVFTRAETLAGARISGGRRGAASRAQRKLMKELARMNLGSDVINTIKEILVELIRAANSNPLIGVLLAIAITDILVTLRILTPTAATAIYAVIAAVVGVDLASDLISSLAGLVPPIVPFTSKGATSAPSSLIEPSATTIVYGERTSALGVQGPSGVDLQALMGLLAKAKAQAP
jgi:hypothetical protein